MKKLIVISACVISAMTSYSQQLANRNRHIPKIKNANAENLPVTSDPGNGFMDYVDIATNDIALNDKSIDELKSALMCEQKNSIKKLRKMVSSLEIENDELKKELSDYINYGIGNWKIFKKEFNQDIALVQEDLNQLVNAFVSEDMLAVNNK